MRFMSEMKTYLAKTAKSIDIHLSERQLEQFDVFYERLIETNKSLNLTAITDMEEVALKHFIDSIALVKYMDMSGKKIIDVGTGAGFPGIPLAIMYPNTRFTLMDSLNKRLKFINQVVEECNMNNITTVHGRAEDLGRQEEYREQFDYCVSRAVAPLPVLLELCTPFVKVGGQFISYKSELMEEELGTAKRAMELLKCRLKEKYSYTIPNSEFYRIFAIFHKTDKLGNKYPRQAGKPKKSPL